MSDYPLTINDPNLLTTGRGTTAIWVVLKSLNKPGKKVLVAANVCEVVIVGILHAQMIPVFHDVDADTGSFGLSHIQSISGEGVAAFIAVHNYGIPLNMQPLNEWAAKNGVYVIEDVCNSLGARHNGTFIGYASDAAIHSFGSSKVLNLGGGGAVWVKDPEMLQKVAKLLDTLPPQNEEILRADAEYQSKLRLVRQTGGAPNPNQYRSLYEEYAKHLIHKPKSELLKKLRDALLSFEKEVESRTAIAYEYQSRFGGFDADVLQKDQITPGRVFWRYSVFVDAEVRNQLVEKLRAEEIRASTWFPSVGPFFFEKDQIQSFPGAERFCSRVINLWVDSAVNSGYLNKTLQIFREFFATKSSL